MGVNQLEKVVRCVLCKGARYPPTIPRPNMALLDIQLPMCDPGNEKSQLEEALIQSSIQMQLTANRTGSMSYEAGEAADKAERTFKESLMKMFAVSPIISLNLVYFNLIFISPRQLACQAERDSRAIEVAEWMRSEAMLQLAVKYATRARKRLLADRLTDMAQLLLQEQREEEELEEVEAEQRGFGHTSSVSRRSSSLQQPDEDRDMFACTPPVLEVEGSCIIFDPF